MQVFGSVCWWLVAQRIPNSDLGFFNLNISLGLIVCQTGSVARLCNCAFSFIIIFRADLFLIDWGLLGPSLALSCSGQSTWQPSKDHACRRCCRLPLLTGGYRLGLRLPLFFHSGLLFLGLGWLSKSYWMLCRVGALSCTVYVGNCVHCSGLISWCLHFSFLSDSVNGMGVGRGRGHARVKAVCVVSWRAHSHNEGWEGQWGCWWDNCLELIVKTVKPPQV